MFILIFYWDSCWKFFPNWPFMWFIFPTQPFFFEELFEQSGYFYVIQIGKGSVCITINAEFGQDDKTGISSVPVYCFYKLAGTLTGYTPYFAVEYIALFICYIVSKYDKNRYFG